MADGLIEQELDALIEAGRKPDFASNTAAHQRWMNHANACVSERICPLDGAQLGTCGHTWHKTETGWAAGMWQVMPVQAGYYHEQP